MLFHWNHWKHKHANTDRSEWRLKKKNKTKNKQTQGNHSKRAFKVYSFEVLSFLDYKTKVCLKCNVIFANQIVHLFLNAKRCASSVKGTTKNCDCFPVACNTSYNEQKNRILICYMEFIKRTIRL